MQERDNNQPFTSLVEQKEIDIQTFKHFEGLMTQGSGFFHVRGSLEEGIRCAPQNESYMRLPANVTIETPRHPVSKYGVYIPGVCGRHPLLNEVAVNLPYFLGFSMKLDGESLCMDNGNLLGHTRTLDLRSGVLCRRFTARVASGASLDAVYRRMACRHAPHLFAQEMTFVCGPEPCDVQLRSFIDCDVKTNGYNHFADLACGAEGTLCWARVQTDVGHHVAMASHTVLGMGDSSSFVPGPYKSPLVCEVGHTVSLQPGQQLVVHKVTALGLYGPESRDETLDKLSAQAQAGANKMESLFTQNQWAWAALWDDCLVEIDGDDDLQYALNVSMYHLLRAANPDNPYVTVCAKGFAGEAYFGHFFWDTEVYLSPFFLYTRPETAKALSTFRQHTLEGARVNAKSLGEKGAKYPWESSVSGTEQCPNWQYADNEIHINADVVYGLWHTYQVTKDEEFWLLSLPVLVETARYYRGRTMQRKDGSLGLHGVMGPDEYICFCNNNVYTNRMAIFTWETTCQALALVRAQFPDAYARLYEELSLSGEEIASFAQAALLLCPQTFAQGVVDQCDHFDDFEDVDFSACWPDRSEHFAQTVSQEFNYRVKALKQADLLMLPFLFRDLFSREQLAENFDYYLPITTHDSSLSYVVHATLAFWLNRREQAYSLLSHALRIDLDASHGGASEGIHIANCGGIWQAVVFGMCGLRRCYESQTLSFAPVLPAHIHAINLRLNWQGKRVSVRILSSGEVTVTERK